jgi:hypothetical protein
VVEPIYPGSNSRFNISVIFIVNYFLVVDNVSIDNDAPLLMVTSLISRSVGPIFQEVLSKIGCVFIFYRDEC